MALNNYIEDDWDDNALTNRSGSQKDVFYSFSDGGTGDLLKGVYRPRWETLSGSPSLSSGELLLSNDTGNQTVSTTSNKYSGEWIWDINTDATMSSNGINTIFVGDGTDPSISFDSYYSTYKANGDWQIELHTEASGFDSVILLGSWPNDSNSHTYRIVRSSYGEFEQFRDGSSQGTATDSSVNESKIFTFRNSSDINSYFDNLLVR